MENGVSHILLGYLHYSFILALEDERPEAEPRLLLPLLTGKKRNLTNHKHERLFHANKATTLSVVTIKAIQQLHSTKVRPCGHSQPTLTARGGYDQLRRWGG